MEQQSDVSDASIIRECCVPMMEAENIFETSDLCFILTLLVAREDFIVLSMFYSKKYKIK
jgi:hypothetical protein